MARRHRRDVIVRLLAERERKGLTFREVSERSGIPIPTLAWWASKLRHEGEGVEAELIPVEILEEQSGAPIAIELGRDVRVVVVPGFDAEHLARVLSVLESRC